MSSRIGICSFAGGVALFLWGFLSWGVLDFRMNGLQPFKDNDAVTQVLEENTDGHGIYVHPRNQEADGAMKGPFAYLIFRPGEMPSMGSAMLRGFLIYCIAAGFVTNLLVQSKVETYGGRILYCVVVCLAGGFLIRMSDWTWWHYPTSYIAMEMVNLVISGVILGLVIGKLINPKDKSQKPQSSLAK